MGVAHLQVLGQAYDYTDLNMMLTEYINSQGLNDNPPRKFVTDGYRGNYTLKNNTNNDLEIDLYWCLARRDITTSQLQRITFGNGVAYEDITQVLVDGYKEQTNTTVTSGTWPLATTPFQITRFCEFFKIMSSKRVLLGGGRNVTVKMNLPRSIHWQSDMIAGVQAGSAGANYSLYGGKSMTLMAITRGQVINDTTTPTMISTADVLYNMLGEESYTFYPSSGIVSQLVVPTPLSTVTSYMNLTQEQELLLAPTHT